MSARIQNPPVLTQNAHKPISSVLPISQQKLPLIIHISLKVFEAAPPSHKKEEHLPQWRALINAINTFPDDKSYDVARCAAIYLRIYFNISAFVPPSIFTQVPPNDVPYLVLLRLQQKGLEYLPGESPADFKGTAHARFQNICAFFELLGNRKRENAIQNLKKNFESLKDLEQENWIDQITLYLSKTRIHSLNLQTDYILFCHDHKLPLLTPFSALLEVFETDGPKSPYYKWVIDHFSAYSLRKELDLLEKGITALFNQEDQEYYKKVANAQSLVKACPSSEYYALPTHQINWVITEILSC